MNIVECPYCHSRVAIGENGICPSCRGDIRDTAGTDSTRTKITDTMAEPQEQSAPATATLIWPQPIVPKQSGKRRRVFWTPLSIILLSSFILFSSGFMLWITYEAYKTARKASEEQSKRLDMESKIHATTLAQDMYKFDVMRFHSFHKRMPESRAELKGNSYIPHDEDGWGNPMRLDVAEDHYSVTSAGPDQRMDTDDDIKTIFNHEHEVTEVVNGITMEDFFAGIEKDLETLRNLQK